MTPEQDIFNRMVKAHSRTCVWTGSYAQGLFDAFVAFTDRDPQEVLEALNEAVDDAEQRHQ